MSLVEACYGVSINFDCRHHFSMDDFEVSNIGIIVAHPDDETLWAGGTVLLHPGWRCRIYTLCRAGDTDRAPKFSRVLEYLGAEGKMADLDDGPAQAPLDETLLRRTIRDLVGNTDFDLLITHGPSGEYTYHQRHVEVSRAVTALWLAGELRAKSLWLFAYEDGQRAYYPRANTQAHRSIHLPPNILARKTHIIRDLYGFAPESWEAHTTPATEAFWCFDAPADLERWLQERKDSS